MALLFGTAVALLFAFVTVTLKANQIVAGIAINLLVMGATRFGLTLLFGSAMNSPRLEGFAAPFLLLDPLFLTALFSVGVGLNGRKCGDCR
jgi:simple sugar transport system permease protein